jgi:hypothetical protein
MDPSAAHQSLSATWRHLPINKRPPTADLPSRGVVRFGKLRLDVAPVVVLCLLAASWIVVVIAFAS